MKRFIIAAALVTVGVTTAFAGPIEDRQALMKSIAATTKAAAGYAKGDTPFDAAKVKALLQVYVDDAAKLPTLFPDDSKTGETRAAPKVWENKADVTARFTKLAADAGDAAPKVVDEASMEAIYPALQQECDSCHEQYRLRRR